MSFLRSFNSIIRILVLGLLIVGCNKSNQIPDSNIDLTIFFVNDYHSQIDNFSKIKDIVDKEREKTNVIVVGGGDIFSGSPVVDYYPEKGYPMIDMMNRVGFDVAVVGNHEYDYGEQVLKDRFEQAEFSWVCANVDMGSTGVPQPLAYKTIEIGNSKITFLGLVETNGKQDAIIPSTHPWRVQNFVFERPESVVGQYSNLKTTENADLLIALTHLGFNGGDNSLGDVQLAEQFPYFDLIIGGHSHQKINTIVNNIPVYQAGSYLNHLGKLELSVKQKKIADSNFELIDLSTYAEFDSELKIIIDEYNNLPYLAEVVGNSEVYHDRSQVGCFVADALLGRMNVDVSFQNGGGIRSDLDEGDITKREIYEISPFNNGTVIYSMSVLEIKNFLSGTGSGFYYSGIEILQDEREVIIKGINGSILADNVILKVGVLDYIAAVNESYFPANGEIQELNDAQTIISYLQTINSQVHYQNCSHYFRFQY